MIVAGDQCEPMEESLFPCGCWVGVVAVNTGEASGKWRVVLRPCNDECERGQRFAAQMEDE